MIKNVITNRRGTALLVALLVMGVLIAVSLILSSLIFREVRITGDIVDSGKAYYAAESGIEIALFELENNLPGWGTENKDGDPAYLALQLDEEFDAVGEYKVDNSCNAYPCFDPDVDHKNAPASAYYSYLDLNESVTIPLFVMENGQEKPVQEFTVQFYAAFDLDDLNLQNANSDKLSGWDILRWKLFGIYDGPNVVGDAIVTETISDFTAISTYRQDQLPSTFDLEVPDFGNIPSDPSWFGSVDCDNQPGRDNNDIQCNPYVEDVYAEPAYFTNKLYEDATSDQEEEIQQSGYESGILVGQCTNTEAREVYVYGGDGKIDDSDDIKECYPIGDFLDTHRLNYLVLTNLMNPAVIKDTFSPSQKSLLSRLYYRVEVFGDDEVVREFAQIESNGYSGDIKQSIDVQIKRGSFMPVFNFTLYSTYKEGSCEEWYGGDCPSSP